MKLSKEIKEIEVIRDNCKALSKDIDKKIRECKNTITMHKQIRKFLEEN